MPHLYDPTLFSDPRVSPLPPTKPTAKVHQRAYSEKDKVSAFDSHSGVALASSSARATRAVLSGVPAFFDREASTCDARGSGISFAA